MSISYTRIGDYLLPNLKLEVKERFNIGKYGLLKLEYLKKNKTGYILNYLWKINWMSICMMLILRL